MFLTLTWGISQGRWQLAYVGLGREAGVQRELLLRG